MRLVDADALKTEFDKNCAMECACCDHATCNHVGNAVGCGLVDAAPTVDAIPVEWLEKQADYARSEWDYDSCEGIRMVLKAWQKEQEAVRST